MDFVVFQQANTKPSSRLVAAHWCGDNILCPVTAAWMFKNKLILKVSKMMPFVAEGQRHGQSKGCRPNNLGKSIRMFEFFTP